MSNTNPKNQTAESKTRIVFDLADELTADEIKRFEDSAKAAGAESLTDHFLGTVKFRLPATATTATTATTPV